MRALSAVSPLEEDLDLRDDPLGAPVHSHRAATVDRHVAEWGHYVVNIPPHDGEDGETYPIEHGLEQWYGGFPKLVAACQ